MQTIFKKELNSFFTSFSGCFAIIFFITSTGGLLWINPSTSILYGEYASLQSFFDFAPFIMIILCSLITMGIWSSERKSGMIEILFTSPIKIYHLILGKYFANLCIIFFSIILTTVYYFSIYYLANPIGNIDSASIISSYFGLILLSASLLAIGNLGAAISENQIIAFIINTFLCFSYYYVFEMLSKAEFLAKISSFLYKLSASAHYYSLGRGLLDSRDIIFFIATILTMIYFTKIILVKKR